MKRFASILTTFALAAMLLIPTAFAEPAYVRGEDGVPDLQGERFRIWCINDLTEISNDYGDFNCIKRLEEMTNCDIVFLHPPVGQEQDNFAIMMAGDDLPDMLFSNCIDNYYPGGIMSAYDDGILFDYTDLVNEENTPNFMSQVMSDPFLTKVSTDDEGRIVRLGATLCGSEEADFQFYGLVVRSDSLAETGLDMPETIADWYEMLTAMKQSGVEYPLLVDSVFDLGVFAYAWDILANDYSMDSQGQVVYGPYTEQFREYLTEMNRWYGEELLNRDYMNLSLNDSTAMLINDRAGASHAHAYIWQSSYIPAVEAVDESRKLIPAQNPKLSDGASLTRVRPTSRGMNNYRYITVDAKNPLACVYLLDTLYLPEIDRLVSYGIEGNGWTNVDGYPVRIDIPATEPLDVRLDSYVTWWNTHEDDDLTQVLKYKYSTNNVPEALTLWMECGKDGRLSGYIMLTTEESKIKSQLATDIDTYVREMTLKFITGIEPLDRFDEYTAQLKALGVEDLIAVYQAAQDRYESR